MIKISEEILWDSNRKFWLEGYYHFKLKFYYEDNVKMECRYYKGTLDGNIFKRSQVIIFDKLTFDNCYIFHFYRVKFTKNCFLMPVYDTTNQKLLVGIDYFDKTN